jgi:hypothetical protein
MPRGTDETRPGRAGTDKRNHEVLLFFELERWNFVNADRTLQAMFQPAGRCFAEATPNFRLV